MISKSSLLAIAVLVAACGGSIEPAPITPPGTYRLTTVDSSTLPAKRTSGDSVLSGGAILYANGAYFINWFSPSYYFGTRDVIVTTDSGQWGVNGSQLQFASITGANWSGAFNPPSMSIHLRTSDWTFTKQ
jgi:hypothetical protein